MAFQHDDLSGIPESLKLILEWGIIFIIISVRVRNVSRVLKWGFVTKRWR
jgi:hypothetical protein